jgi:serine/threonine protein kinase
MEFFPLTLKELIAKKGKFSSNEIKSFLKQLGDALETTHFKIQNPIVHCDIKPSNIGVHELTSGKYHYKFMDFDVSMELDEKTHKSMITSSAGYTPEYSPPEQVMTFIKKKE